MDREAYAGLEKFNEYVIGAKTQTEQRMMRLLQLRFGLRLEIADAGGPTKGEIFAHVKKTFGCEGGPTDAEKYLDTHIKSMLH